MAVKKVAGVKFSATPKGQDPAIFHGYRSGLEEHVAAQLEAANYPFEFEKFSIPFTPPIKTRSYTPDFYLPNGIIVETKGRFMTADRQKQKEIKAEHPELDIRFVFSRATTPISKTSKTTYAKGS